MRAALAAAVSCAVMGSAGRASAFCRTTTCDPDKRADCQLDEQNCAQVGAPLYWPGLRVQMSVGGGSARRGIDATTARDVLFGALNNWTRVDCGSAPPSIAVESVDIPSPGVIRQRLSIDDGPDAGDTREGVNALLFYDDSWTDREPTAIAITTVQFGTRSGQIFQADIEVNSHGFEIRSEGTGYNLTDILTHETGHFYGLAHSRSPASVMGKYYSIDLDPHSRELTADDIGGICAIYPPGRFDAEGGWSCRLARSGRAAPGGTIALLLGALATMWRRRARVV